MSDTYLTSNELRDIASTIDSLDSIFHKMVEPSAITLEGDIRLQVIDLDGDTLGVIGWTGSEWGARFYPSLAR